MIDKHVLPHIFLGASHGATVAAHELPDPWYLLAIMPNFRSCQGAAAALVSICGRFMPD